MRALFRAQMLAAHVPADIHQLDGVERRFAAPRRRRRMGAFAGKGIFDRDQAGAGRRAPGGGEIAADMSEDDRIDILEDAVADHEGLAADQFLGDARPEHQRARDLLALHQLLQRERSDEIDRLAAVMAFAMARSALDHRRPPGDARLLRGLGNAVYVAAQCDHRTPGAVGPACDPSGRQARSAPLDREAVLLEQVGEVARGLDLLEAELAEAEDHVVDLLSELRARFDAGDGAALQAGDRRRRSRRRDREAEEECGNQFHGPSVSGEACGLGAPSVCGTGSPVTLGARTSLQPVIGRPPETGSGSY